MLTPNCGKLCRAENTSWQYWSRERSVSRFVKMTEIELWSWMRPRRGAPEVGVRYWNGAAAML